MIDLLSTQSRVETPFITCEIAGIKFGVFDKQTRTIYNKEGRFMTSHITYPNFIESCNIVKNANGTVNNYILNMVYIITPGDDPNLLEKIFSKSSKDRKILFSYGDYSNPTFTYRNEEAIITDISSNVEIASNRITYTIKAVSNSILKSMNNYNFQAITAKPSDVIKNLLVDLQYGLIEVFPGMGNIDLVNQRGLIASNDKVVNIDAQINISVLDYIKYLIGSMVSTEVPKTLPNEKYILNIHDDIDKDLGGTYFTVNHVQLNDLYYDYEVNIGYLDPKVEPFSFSIDNKQTYSILYEYNKEDIEQNYRYRWDNEGNQEYLPSFAINQINKLPHVNDQVWWSNMINFPITASLNIKGLLRNVVLMQKIKINVLFFGKEHISTGVYVITGQTDSISSQGYRTNLKLLRISGE